MRRVQQAKPYKHEWILITYRWVETKDRPGYLDFVPPRKKGDIVVGQQWHTRDCREEELARKRARQQYKKRWPNYCRDCDGVGYHSWEENQSPLGSGYYWPETLTEPCPTCSEAGVCPRCGQNLVDEFGGVDEYNEQFLERESPCPICGWDWDHGEEDSLPPPPECYCWHHGDYPPRVSHYTKEIPAVYMENQDLYEM